MKTLKEALMKAGEQASEHERDYWLHFLASLESNGYCIAPVKATIDMECAVTDPDDCATPDAAARVWRAMLAARPKLGD